MKCCKCSLLLYVWISDQILESSHGQRLSLCVFIISKLNMKGNCYELVGFLCCLPLRCESTVPLAFCPVPSGGAAGMVSRITGTVGKGLAAITLDEEFQQKRREEMGRQPKDFGESLAKGGKGLLRVWIWRWVFDVPTCLKITCEKVGYLFCQLIN